MAWHNTMTSNFCLFLRSSGVPLYQIALVWQFRHSRNKTPSKKNRRLPGRPDQRVYVRQLGIDFLDCLVQDRKGSIGLPAAAWTSSRPAEALQPSVGWSPSRFMKTNRAPFQILLVKFLNSSKRRLVEVDLAGLGGAGAESHAHRIGAILFDDL